MARTSLEEKIQRLKEDLKNKKAELKSAKSDKSKEDRRQRANQLVSFGIMLETKYKSLPEAERVKIRGWSEILDARNRARVEEGFARLETGSTRKEISSEPPSQQPEAGAAHAGQGRSEAERPLTEGAA